MAESCGHDYERSYAIEDVEFIDHLSQFQFIKRNSAARSWLCHMQRRIRSRIT
jgi:hypothetical protein